MATILPWNRPPPNPISHEVNDDLIINVKIFGKDCNLIESSDLYFKIKDHLSWFIINYASSTQLENLKFDSTFLDQVENLLNDELNTRVKVIQVSSCKPENYLTEILINVSLKLDQEYINNYVDGESQEMIESMFIPSIFDKVMPSLEPKPLSLWERKLGMLVVHYRSPHSRPSENAKGSAYERL